MKLLLSPVGVHYELPSFQSLTSHQGTGTNLIRDEKLSCMIVFHAQRERVRAVVVVEMGNMGNQLVLVCLRVPDF